MGDRKFYQALCTGASNSTLGNEDQAIESILISVDMITKLLRANFFLVH